MYSEGQTEGDLKQAESIINFEVGRFRAFPSPKLPWLGDEDVSLCSYENVRAM